LRKLCASNGLLPGNGMKQIDIADSSKTTALSYADLRRLGWLGHFDH